MLQRKEEYDVIVIGAGPSGLLSALELADYGWNVALIERKRNVEHVARRACSMQFILDDDYQNEGVMVEDSCLRFPKSGFAVPYNGKKIPIYKKYYHSPDGHVITFGDGKAPFSYKFDKKELLLGLYEVCVQKGVTFYLEALCRSVVDHGDHVEVSALGIDSSTFLLRCGKLIDAEGVNAYIATKMGLNRSRRHLATALTVKAYMRTGCEKEGRVFIM